MLTDAKCRNATCESTKPRTRFADGGGLYLEVAATGGKRWFAKYRFGGKERRLALGSYPDLSLKAAREATEAARRTRRGGADPVQARKIARVATVAANNATFEGVAREFHALRLGEWSDAHARQWIRCCEKDLFPWLGAMPLAKVTSPLLIETLKRVHDRGATQIAHDLRAYAGQVFAHGIRTARCEDNPATNAIGGLPAHHTHHMGALTDPVEAGALMRAIDAYEGQPATRAALQLSALLFQRPGNMRAMEWVEIDVDKAVWTIPSAKMKRRVNEKTKGAAHLVPLPAQALEVLEAIRPLTGHGRFVFPSLLGSKRCMSENTVRTALRRMGYTAEQMTAHGFRAMARTLIAEHMPDVSPEVIEAQLAHGKGGPLGAAYDRSRYLVQRRKMLAWWADYLDDLRRGAEVIALDARRA